MKLQPQLYIDTSGNPLGEPLFERVDFFDFESIELTSTVQDFRDISKVFTDYSQTFNVPASRNNNKIFKHYYNTNIENGFDARIKQKAEIYLNGIFWKLGYIRLTKAIISKGKPKSYRITFFGSLTNLSNVLGNTEISELYTLDKYNHEYDYLTVYDGFTEGLQLSGDTMGNGENRDIIYPSISATDKWYYDSHSTSHPEDYNQGYSVNIYDNTGSGHYGINWLSLKPAIKVKHIIAAIQEKYTSINFSNDFFGSEEFNNLYMLLHNNKGALAPVSNSTDYASVTYRIGTSNADSDFVINAGETEARPMTTYWEVPSDGADQRRVFQYHVIVDVSNTVKSGGGTNPVYTLEILDGNTTIDRFQDIEGDNEVTSVLCTENVREWTNVKVKISSRENELANFEMDLELKRVRYKLPYDGFENTCDVSNFTSTGGVPVEVSSTYSTSVSGTQTLVQTIEITKNMPKMKILDFLTGIFKMFNLTAKPNNEGVIVVKTLNQFYNDGNTIDITNKINTEEIGVNRMDLFKNIEFKFSEPNTFGLLNNNEISNTDYGNLEYQATADGTDSNLVFDGKDYKVKLPFEKMYYERLFDENNVLSRTEFGNGWLVDKDQNEIITKPLLFYNVVQPIDSSRTPIGFKDVGTVTQYNRASNSNSSEYFSGGNWNVIEGTKSLNFNTEYDEFSLTEVSRGLFRKHYQDYITSIFDKGTRVFNIEMKADLAFLLQYEINDTLTIKGEEFLINNIRTNLTNGLTKLELVLKFFIESVDESTGVALTAPTGLFLLFKDRSSVSFNWNENPSNQLVKGYNIYVGGVLTDSILFDTSYTLTGLDPSTTYSIQVSAYNSQGDESSLSSALSVTTLATDNEPPTAPRNLSAFEVSDSSVGVKWSASSDNVGVSGYEVYVDGVLTQTTTSTLAWMSGFSSNTVYEIYVRAKDAVPNYSEISNTIQVRTL